MNAKRQKTDTPAQAAAARILPDVADVKLNPAPPLASLCATPPEWQPAVKLSELCELIFAQLQDEMPIADPCDPELFGREESTWRGSRERARCRDMG